MATTATVRKIISTATAPKPVGPYNQAVVVDKTVYVAGSIGLVPETGALISSDVKEQTEQALKNIGEVLKAAGSSFHGGTDSGETTVLLADLKDYSDVNTIYAKYFTSKFPARAAYQVAALPLGAKIEIEAVGIVEEIIDK